MHVEMRIQGVNARPVTNMPIIILSDLEGTSDILPIWVGFFEANAIALQMENVATPRPMTNDLMKSIINGLNATVKKILVNNLSENSFTRFVYLEAQRGNLAIDSRAERRDCAGVRVKSPDFCGRGSHQQGKERGGRPRPDRRLENLRSGSRISAPRKSASTRCNFFHPGCRSIHLLIL